MLCNALAALLVALSPLSAAAGELDGTRWKMRFRNASNWLPVWKADVMSFEDGRFRSSECASYGFAESPYGAAPAQEGEAWSATLFNADGERTDWKGVQKGDRMEGTFIWSTPDGQRREYKFRAKKR